LAGQKAEADIGRCERKDRGVMAAAFFFIAFTVSVYFTMKGLYNRFPTPLLIPILTSTVFIAGVLSLFQIPYETYMEGGKWIDELLGPAVVALAFPLYYQRNELKRYFWTILAAVLTGAIIGVLSGVFLASLLRLDKEIVLSLAPKSVTSPVAMDIAGIIGGIPSLAAVYVVIAGIFGAVLGPLLLNLFKINHSLGIGISLGCASHGIGTAKALEIGRLEAAISSIAMTLSATFVSLLLPAILLLL